MVDMLKDFDDVCTSKMMLGDFQDMMKGGLGRILEFFDRAQFNPPLMRPPIMIEWPEELERLIFASETSLIDEERLEKELAYWKPREHWWTDKCLRVTKKAKAPTETATGDPEKAKGCRKCCNQLREVFASFGLCKRDKDKEKYGHALNTDERKSPVRRITVQSLDFDWIFEETAGGRMKNVETLVTEVLYKHSSEEVFNRKAIQVFIDLMWQTF